MIGKNRMSITVSSILIAICISYSMGHSVETSLWEVNTFDSFQAGTPIDVSIRSDDQVILSSSLQFVYDTGELYVWCLVQDAKGHLYVGTGNDGKIFAVTKDGQGALLFDSPELEILCLAVDRKGNLYAGTAPGGLIYRIAPDGAASTFVETGEKYVWSLAFDAADNLLAATGDGGKILKISPKGQIEMLYDSNETHIMALVFDSQGNLYAGSEGNGIVYRISPRNDVFVLYDPPQKEIHALALSPNNNLFVGATETVIHPQKAPIRKEEPSTEGGEGEVEVTVKPVEPVRVAKENSAVYQVSPDGVATKRWTSSALLLAQIARDDGSLLVGTDDEGKLFMVTEEKISFPAAQCEETQILAMLEGNDDRVLVGTGNMGKIYRFASEYVKEGSLESDPYDAGTISRWGKISWDAELPSGTSVTLSTRSGNSENPDDTWSDWSDAYAEPGGRSITSPAARFIQWRAKLATGKTSSTPILKGVRVAYLPRNLQPEIDDLAVVPAGQRPAAGAKKPGKPGDSAINSFSSKGARSVEWASSDPNADDVIATIYFRGSEEKTWKMLKDDVVENTFTLDTESMPDGIYQIKVVVSDNPDNPAVTALSAEKVSEPFLVDNTPPRVFDIQASQGSGKGRLITGRAEDVAGIITDAEYSIDAGEWQKIIPKDEIFDSKQEIFAFTVEEVSSGEHTLVIRTTDEAGNIGAGKVVFEVK
jgi:hypothetical protein